MTKNKISKKILSIIVCIALLMSYLPTMMSSAAAAGEEDYYEKIVDANTMDLWKEYFPIEEIQDNPLTPENEYRPITTANAGGVWTDKTVLSAPTSQFSQSGITMIDGEKNFLTALSAIAANKEIVGYSTVPTDTVFILDLSNSMDPEGDVDYVDDLVDATNQAIASLQAINKNNRVGVVLYSGTSANRTYNDAVAALMPIDRYTTTNADGKFIEHESGVVALADNWQGVQVTGSNGAVVSESKTSSGATYIQAGLWEAYKMFDAVPDDDIYIGDNNWQKDEYRMPIVVLMTDGAPTLGTSYFADVENSTYGNYGNATKANVGDGNDNGITAGQGFLVQLTASYIRNQIEKKYKIHDEKGAGRSLFYTLGFNITPDTNPYNVTSGDVAYSVVNPDASTITNSLWNTYNRLAAQNSTMLVTVEGRNGGESDVSISKNSFATSKSYVDEYFSASGTGLSDAFKDIVEEIILQSRYYPTHLEGGSPDFSGYVEFTDELGDYMEVKHINGILLGDTLFDGHMMASKLSDNSEDGLGTVANPTALGDEFIRAVKTRLGIAETVDAQALVAAAFNAKQLCYETDGRGNVTNWSNYIGWYADAAGKYISHWDEAPNQVVPANAVYKIKSYGFLGETTGSIKNSDMMYMSVQVKTDIATGRETVSWKIPASLVPMVTYLIEVSGTQIAPDIETRLTVEDATNVAPIRLVYETGLSSKLNEFNITSITGEEHISADGHTRRFWNNYFANIDAPSHDSHITTMSEFTPNLENERFYYTFDSVIYKKISENSYVPLGQNETPVSTGEYYHRRYIFKTYPEGTPDNEKVPEFFFEKISAKSIEAALVEGWKNDVENLEHQTVGAWVVPAATPARELDMYDKPKTENLTNSARMVFHPYMTDQNNIVYVDMNLGNNGLLSVTPATGIKISKIVDVFETGTSDTFKFRITASESGTFDSWITAIDATPSTNATAVTLTNGVYEFEMSKDQTFWLTGLPAGATYTVEEISDNADYKIKSVHVNGISTGKTATGTVAQYLIDDVEFVNTAVGEGDLVITKQVVDVNGNIVDVNDNIEFTLNVALADANGNPVSGTYEATGGTITIPANGVFTVKLSDGESFAIRGIHEETEYVVSEPIMPNGFALDNNRSSSLAGVIDSSLNVQALVVNTYDPTGTNGANVNVEVFKAISGNRTEWLNGESYTFNLELVRTPRAASLVATKTIRSSDAEKKALFNLSSESYDAAGTYTYRITEANGNQGGITYDTAVREFSVVVADSDMDGDLEIVSVNNEINTVVSGNWTVTANFNNIYAPTGSATATINIQKSINAGHSPAGFQFALYDANPTDPNAEANIIARSSLTDATGKASVSLTYAANRATMAGVTYTYWLAELEGNNPNITYSTDVHKVEVTVKDNGDGTVSATVKIDDVDYNQANDNVAFTNVYTPSTSDYIAFTGNKTISSQTGAQRGINAGEFEFELNVHSSTPNAPAPDGMTWPVKVRNAADGSFVFPEIEFSAAGTYKYVITEVNTQIGGFYYDTTEYVATVTVTEATSYTPPVLIAEVALEAVDTNATATDIVFNNEYNTVPTTLRFEATKLLAGKTIRDGEFVFEINAVNGAPLPAHGLEYRNDENGKVLFPTIEFTKAGTFVYTISEKNIGDTRYDYDESVYTVTVVVTDNSEGKLFADYTITKDGMPSTEIVFRNGFVPTPIDYSIEANFGLDVEKKLHGRPLRDGEFEFALFNAINGEQIGETVRNDASGNFAFPELVLPEAGTYHYKISEVVGDEFGITYDPTVYHIVIGVEQIDDKDDPNRDGTLEIVRNELHKANIVIDDSLGVLTERVEYTDITNTGSITFENHYRPNSATAVISGEKQLETEHNKTLEADRFEFKIATDDPTTPMPIEATAKNDADGKFDFGTITYDKVGEYNYTVTETDLDETGYTYDQTVYNVTVKVTDIGFDGQLDAEVIVENNASIIFVNGYAPNSVNVTLGADGELSKELGGRDLKDREFEFTIATDDTAAPMPTETTAKNDADGKFTFSIEFNKAGIYEYTICEKNNGIAGVTYDESTYKVTVEIVDDNGQLKAKAPVYSLENDTVASVVFKNTYAPASINVELKGNKQLGGRELADKEFAFDLYAANTEFVKGELIEKAYNNADGDIIFKAIKKDQPGVYHYIIIEDLNDPVANVTYDRTEYHVTVTLTDNLDGTMSAKYEFTTDKGISESLTFVNTYTEPQPEPKPEPKPEPEPVPETGDINNLWMWIAIAFVSFAGLFTTGYFALRKEEEI